MNADVTIERIRLRVMLLSASLFPGDNLLVSAMAGRRHYTLGFYVRGDWFLYIEIDAWELMSCDHNVEMEMTCAIRDYVTNLITSGAKP